MDKIAVAISKKYHVCKNEVLNRQEWEQFEQVAANRKVFLFGAGAVADFFWHKYEGNIPLEGVIDNATEKQGLLVEDVIRDAFVPRTMKIVSCEELKKYAPEEVVVLITSVKYYEEIVMQLEEMGIQYHYVMLIMEANRRASMSERIVEKSWHERREICVKAYSKLPICQKKIVFWAFNTYTDHGKYITEQLLRIRKDLDIVWLVKDIQQDVPNGVRLVDSQNWKQYIYEMETAHIWVFNAVCPSYIIKRPEQIFIQTKHWASITLKKFYLDASTITDVPEDVAHWKYVSKCMDYIITGSDFDTESCRRGFDFHKEVIQIGSPRSDAMFRKEEMKEKVCSYYQIEKDCRILLYAPTYRYKRNEERHIAEIRSIDIAYDKVKETLEEKFGGSWYILLRLHPGHEKEMEGIKRPDYVLDGSNYSDGQELASACDILITDYSSIMFEPAFVKKTVFLFATDKEEYIDKEYDLLIDYDTLPFPIAQTNVELQENIRYFDKQKYDRDVEVFLDKYGVCEDGHASERAAKFISKLINE